MKIHLVEDIASGAAFVAPILVERLAKIHREPLGSQTLTSFGVTVEIAIAVGATVGEPPDGAEITMQASSENAALFPVFEGTLCVQPVDTFSSQLVLDGEYSVPLGALGAFADRTLLAGTAERSLQNFLGEARDEIAAAVLRAATGS